MIVRSIFPELLNHLAKPQATVITGMRRVGKSTALKYLLAQVPHHSSLTYFQKTNGAEIDFVVNGQVAVEVKETPSALDLRQLQQRAKVAGLSEQ